jgi:methoxymalonate biosynthesis acyl carrier protein
VAERMAAKSPQHQMVAISDDLEQFVRRAFAVGHSDPNFDRSVDLFDAGYVDSVGITEMLAYINETYGIDIPDEHLLSDEFASIDGMAAVIFRMR